MEFTPLLADVASSLPHRMLIYQFLHLVGLLGLVGVLFAAFANPDPSRKKISMMFSGISSLAMLITGFGMLALHKEWDPSFPKWLMVKLVCWLFLAAVPALAFRRPTLISLWRGLSVAALVLALAMVIFRPI